MHNYSISVMTHSKSRSSKTLLAVIAIVMCSLPACQSGGSKEDAKSGLVIGVSMLSLQSEFVVNVNDAVEARDKEMKVELNISDGQRTAEKHVQQVETFISHKVDA